MRPSNGWPMDGVVKILEDCGPINFRPGKVQCVGIVEPNSNYLWIYSIFAAFHQMICGPVLITSRPQQHHIHTYVRVFLTAHTHLLFIASNWPHSTRAKWAYAIYKVCLWYTLGILPSSLPPGLLCPYIIIIYIYRYILVYTKYDSNPQSERATYIQDDGANNIQLTEGYFKLDLTFKRNT